MVTTTPKAPKWEALLKDLSSRVQSLGPQRTAADRRALESAVDKYWEARMAARDEEELPLALPEAEFPTNIITTEEGWTFKWIQWGPTGEPEEYTAISPEGVVYTRAELEGALIQQGDYELLYKEYQRTGGELSFEDWQAIGAPIRPFAEQVFGKVFPELDVSELLAYAEAQPEAFLRDIIDIGRTPETEALLRTMAPGITEEDIEGLFVPELVGPTPLPIPPEGIAYTIEDEEGNPLDLRLLEDWEFVGTERRLRSNDLIVFGEGREVGRYIQGTGEFVLKEPEWWEKTLGVAFKVVDWALLLPTLIGISSKYPQYDAETIGREIAYDKLRKYYENLPKGVQEQIYSGSFTQYLISDEGSRLLLRFIQEGAIEAKQLEKNWATEVLPGGELHKKYRELPTLEQLAREAPFWVFLGLIGASALQARAALGAAAVGRPAVTRAGIQVARAALAPVAGIERAVAYPLRFVLNKPAQAVFNRTLRKNFHKYLVSQGVKLSPKAEEALLRAFQYMPAPKAGATYAAEIYAKMTTKYGSRAVQTYMASGGKFTPDVVRQVIAFAQTKGDKKLLQMAQKFLLQLERSGRAEAGVELLHEKFAVDFFQAFKAAGGKITSETGYEIGKIALAEAQKYYPMLYQTGVALEGANTMTHTLVMETLLPSLMQITPQVLTVEMIAGLIPAGVTLSITRGLIAQLKDLGHTAEAIEAMKPEEAWANLFKAPVTPVGEPVVTPPVAEVTPPAVAPPEVPAVKPPAIPAEVPAVPEVIKFPSAVVNHILDKINTRTGLAARLATFTDRSYAQLVKSSKAELETLWETDYPANREMARASIAEAQRQAKGAEPAPIISKLPAVEVAKPIIPEATKAQQAEYTRRIKPFLDKATAEIKKVNDDFTAGKTSLAENQTQRDAINAELDRQADRIRAEMGFPVAKPPAKPIAPEMSDKRAGEVVTEPRPSVEAPPESVPRLTVRHPKFAQSEEDIRLDLKQEFHDTFEGSVLGEPSASYLQNGDFGKFVDLMPDVAGLKLEALSDELKTRIAELEELRPYILEGRDLVAFEKIVKKLKGGVRLTIDDAASLGIALRKTRGGNLVPAIRRSGFYVSTDFVEYPNFEDVGYTSGRWMDTMTLFEAIDGGYATGMAQKDILYPTHITHLARGLFVDSYSYKVDKLTEQFGLEADKKLRKVTWDVVQQISRAEADFKTADLVRKPEIQRFISKYDKATQARLVEFSQGVRALLDDLIGKQNAVRAKRGQDSIAYREKYLAWVAESNIWSRLGWLRKTPADFFQKPPLPDYIKPDAPFNPRAMAREGGMGGYEMERDVRKLLKDYVNTAGKDIFNTNIIHNAKIHTATLRSMGYENSAKLIEDWASEAYAGVLSPFEKGARGVVPRPMLRSIWFVRRQLTRAVFPLNWLWNVTIQPSSIAFTVSRYGVRNTIRGLAYLFDSDAKAYVRQRYSWIIKSKRGGKMAYQDIGQQVSGNLWTEGRLIDKAEMLGNFMTNLLEDKLTGISIIAARHHGESLGFTGVDLNEFASKGGGKTQSMYNFEDLPGVLRSKTIGSLFPFQTFTFQALNFVREIVGIRRFRAGAYETISATSAEGKATVARRLKMVVEFLVVIMVINMVVDRATNRKPWRISSFIPFYANLIAGMDAGNTWNWPLPAQYVAEFWTAFNAVVKYDDWNKLRKWTIRYHILGGTQINKMIDGAIALARGEVTDTRGKTMFEVHPDEWLRVIMMGPYASEEGREYVDRIKEKRGGLWYEYTGFPLPERIDITDEIDKSVELLGKTDDEGAPHDFGDVVSAIREIRRSVGEKRFALSVSPFVEGFRQAEASREKFEELPPEKLENMDVDEIADFIFPEADPEDEEITALWTTFNTLKTTEEKRDFIATYIKEHPEELKGNEVANNYNLLQDMWILEGKDLKAFLEKYPDLTKDWRNDWRKENPEDDARLSMWAYGGRIQTREAYELIVKWVGELGIDIKHLDAWLPPPEIADTYFDYNEASEKYGWNSAEARLILATNEQFREWKGLDVPETPVRALELDVEWATEDDEYNALPAEDRDSYLTEHPDYAIARRKREAYAIDFPEELIDTYVEWYTSPDTKKPEDFVGTYYGDDWYLQEHPEFYNAMVDAGVWKERDFSKVPTREVFALYEEWQGLPLGTARRDFEAEHPELDQWLHLTRGTKLEPGTPEPIKDIVEPLKEESLETLIVNFHKAEGDEKFEILGRAVDIYGQLAVKDALPSEDVFTYTWDIRSFDWAKYGVLAHSVHWGNEFHKVYHWLSSEPDTEQLNRIIERVPEFKKIVIDQLLPIYQSEPSDAFPSRTWDALLKLSVERYGAEELIKLVEEIGMPNQWERIKEEIRNI